VAAGDVGVVLAATGAPVWVGVLGAVLGVAGTLVTGRVATARLLAMVDPAGDVAGQLRRLGLFAWLLGAVLAVALSVGGFRFTATGVFEVVGTVSVGVFLLFVRFFMRRLEVPGEGLRFEWPWIGVGALLIVAVLRHLLAGGLQL